MIVFEYELDPAWPKALSLGRVGTLRDRTLHLQYSDRELDDQEPWTGLIRNRLVDRVVGIGLQPADERLVGDQPLLEVLHLPDPVDFVWDVIGVDPRSESSTVDLLDRVTSIEPNPMSRQIADRFGVPRTRYEIDRVLELVIYLGRMRPAECVVHSSLRRAVLIEHKLDALLAAVASQTSHLAQRFPHQPGDEPPGW